jgi:pyruvate kinase
LATENERRVTRRPLIAARAECVMLNMGPYIAEAVTIMDDVLTRMQDHQRK